MYYVQGTSNELYNVNPKDDISCNSPINRKLGDISYSSLNKMNLKHSYLWSGDNKIAVANRWLDEIEETKINLYEMANNSPDKIMMFFSSLRTSDDERHWYSKLFGVHYYEELCKNLAYAINLYLGKIIGPGGFSNELDEQISQYFEHGKDQGRNAVLHRFLKILNNTEEPGSNTTGGNITNVVEPGISDNEETSGAETISHKVVSPMPIEESRRGIKETMRDYKAELEGNREQRAFSRESLHHILLLRIQTMNEYLQNYNTEDDEKQKYNIENDEKLKIISDTASALANLEFDYQGNDKHEFGKIVKLSDSITRKALSKCGLSGDKIHRLYLDSLSKDAEAWTGYDEALNLKGSKGEKYEFRSVLTPANSLGCFDYLNKEDGLRGVGSNDRNTEHIMNLWKTEFKNQIRETLFKGMRHGNTRGKESSTEELVRAIAFMQFGGRLALIDAANGNKGDPLKIKLSSVQILTPNFITMDKTLAFKQIEKLYEWEDKPHNIHVPEYGDILVQLDLVAFNFGVNAMHFDNRLLNVPEAITEAAYSIVGGSSSDYNKRALLKIFGKNLENDFDQTSLAWGCEEAQGPDQSKNYDLILRNTDCLLELEAEKWAGTEIGSYLEDDNKDWKQKKIVLQLAQQICTIWKQGMHNEIGNSDPYAMPARIAILTDMLGYNTAFNCMSGKDRTGLMDIAIKSLVADIYSNDSVPLPYISNNYQRYNSMSLLNNGGSIHVARANTGVEGLKSSTKALKAQLGEISMASSLAES